MQNLKKLLAALLVVCMVVGLVPMTVFAANSATVTTQASTPKTAYVPVSSFDSEGTYLIVSGTNALVADGNSLTSGTVTVTSETITVDGTTYSSYIDGASITSENYKWKASGSSDFTIQNVGTGGYLYGSVSGNSATLSLNTTGSTWTYSDSKLSTQVNNNTRYLRYSNNSWSLNSGKSSTITIYKQVGYTKVETVETTYAISANDVYFTYANEDGTQKPEDQWTATVDTKLTTVTDYTYEVTGDPHAIVENVSVDENGDLVVVFTGNTGAATIELTATYDDNGVTKEISTTVTVYARANYYFTVDDGVVNVPEAPNPGSVTIDKTATAVGNFDDSGIVEMELSMMGVPYASTNEIDVVIMIDMSTSMTEDTNKVADRVTPAREAAMGALEGIVKNEDGTINGSRVAIYTFNGYDNKEGAQNYANAVDEVLSMQDYQGSSSTDSSRLDAALNAVEDWIVEDNTGSGTNYGAALEKCYSVLNAARQENPDRQQYVIFVTDGEPTTGFAYVNDNGGVSDDGYNSDYANGAADVYYQKTEYYSTQMKNAGVEVYSVGIQLDNPNANTILKKIAGNKDGNAYTGGTAYEKYAQFVAANGNVDDLVGIFEDIVNEIKQAATNVTVEDVITDEYELVFSLPSGVDASEAGGMNEFYIEVVKYDLDENYEREGTTENVIRIYVDSEGAYYYNGETKTYYTAYDAETNPTGVTVTFNGDEVATIVCQYFTYDAAGHTNDDGTTSATFVWNTDELSDEYELALRYYLYLTGAGDSTATPGTYPTNKYATISYTNHLGNPCLKYFPEPQMTWGGAQVSYVFYLVNENGQPVNQSGQVVDFRNAVFVTKTYTKSVIWTEQNKLEASQLAADLLPDGYELFDDAASYDIYVYQSNTNLTPNPADNNHFVIGGGEANGATGSTTQVYNTAAGNRYTAYDTYYAADVANGFDFYNTTVAFAVVWTVDLTPDTVVVDFGLPVEINVTANDLLGNTVHGVSLDKATSGIKDTSTWGTTAEDSACKVEKVAESTVRFTQKTMMSAPVTFSYDASVTYYEQSTAKNGYLQTSVTVIPATTVYYEDSFVTLESYTKNGDEYVKDETTQWVVEGTTTDATQDVDRPGQDQVMGDSYDADNRYGYDSAYEECSEFSMNSAVKINVNANTRGEASFTFNGTGFDIIGLTSNTTGTLIVQVKNADGESVKTAIVDTYYGYMQEGYTETIHRCCGFDEDGNAEWSVYVVEHPEGTEIPESDPVPADPKLDDTYTTYKVRWVPTESDDPNALYQVPVMKISGLTYGQYTVKLTAGYNESFDSTGNGNYTLYLDAVRIYDPCGTNNDTANGAYEADGEAYPEFTELRNQIISADTFNSLGGDTVSGIVFIDGVASNSVVSDYTNYGPNNELYLAHNQAVAFNLNAADKTGYAVKSVQLAIKTVGGTGTVEVYSVDEDGSVKLVAVNEEISTATDMYYDITALNGETVVIKNAGDGDDAIVSLTNIKVTYTAASVTASDNGRMLMSVNSESASAALMSLRTVEVEETEPEETTEPEESTEESTEQTDAPTESETEEETTEPEDDNSTNTGSWLGSLIGKIKDMFSKWFR